MNKFNPKVSIVIPVYNGSDYLGEAIDSALAQTYNNLEIIVSNDGSNDNGATEKVAKSYGDKIIYLGKKENGGASTALNAAIKVMTGEYFSWLSHDDMYYPDKIKRQIEELAKLEDKNTIMMTDLDGINEKYEKIYQTNYQAHIDSYPPRIKSNIHPVVYNQTHGCTLLIPKACFETVGLFDVDERVAQDFEYFYRIFLKYPHKLIPEVLVRARDSSYRMGRRAKPRASVEYSRLYIKMLDSLSDTDIKLLAPDELTLLSDMRAFFEAVGYLPALAYTEERIVKYSTKFCENIVQDIIKNGIDPSIALSSINRLRDQLNMIEADNIAALKKLDLTLKDIVISLPEPLMKKYSAVSLDAGILLYDSLLECGYKRASTFFLNRLITTMLGGHKFASVNNLVHTKLDGLEIKPNKREADRLIDRMSSKSKKIRIMFCSTHWLTGGMERVLSILFNVLKTKYEIYLITPFDGRISQVEVPEEVHHIKISNSMFYNQFDNVIFSYSVLLDIKVVVGFYNMFAKQLDLYRLCEGSGIRTVASNHEYYFYPYKNRDLIDIVQNRLDAFKSVDAVVWPTSFSAAVCGLNEDNSYLLANPNTFTVQTRVQPKNDEKIIICVGRFDDFTKRIDRILKCFRLVVDKEPKAKLMIVGKCTRDKVMEAIGNITINELMARLDIDEKSVIFVGEVSDVGKYYARASVLLLASSSEGFGMVINEAACYGVPTVYNAINGVEDLVTDGQNGYVVDQDDIESMADRVYDVLSDDNLRGKLSKNAKKMVERFNTKIISEKWAYLIDTLIEGGDEVSIRSKLVKELRSNTATDRELSKKVFEELNDIFDREARKPSIDAGFYNSNRFIGKHVVRSIKLLRSIDKDGLRKTAGKLKRKIASIRSK